MRSAGTYTFNNFGQTLINALHPTCQDFTDIVTTVSHYSFSAWAQDSDYGWAILRDIVVSSAYRIVSHDGQVPPLTSGYRNGSDAQQSVR
jgi:hypothetical protein